MAEANPGSTFKPENGDLRQNSCLDDDETAKNIMLERSQQVQKRSRNQVKIFLYGKSGSGKSSTLNYLFGTDICPVSNERSKTRNVTEYGCSIENTGWFGKGLNLSFIDTPGLGDTQERGRDPENLAKISYFIENHPELGQTRNRIYPNIVLIVVSATDNRMNGIDSDFSKMLHALINLNVVDRFHPNIVIVVTNAMHFTREQYVESSERIVEICKLFARAHLSIDVPVVFIENKDERNELEQEGDWKILPDGKRQPLNLFEVIKDLMRNSGDEMGVEAVRLLFDNSRKYDFKEIKCNPPDLNVRRSCNKWREILEEEFFLAGNSQIFCALSRKFKLADEKLFPLVYQLQKNNFVKPSDLRNKNLSEIKRALYPFQPDEQEIQWLYHLFNVSLLRPRLNFTLLGVGYSKKFKEKRMPILNVGSLKRVRIGNYEIQIPEQCIAKHPKKIIVDIVYNNNVYFFLKRRLGMHFRINYILFQVVFETFEEASLDPNFIRKLQELFPEGSKPGNLVSNIENPNFPNFVKKYGLHCITGLYFGGYIEGDLYLDYLPDDDNNELLAKKSELLLTLLHDYFTSLQNGTFQNQIHFPLDNEFSQKFKDCTLNCRGGNRKFQSKRISDITVIEWNDWVNSIGEDIVCLDKMRNIKPLFNILLGPSNGVVFAEYFYSLVDRETDSADFETSSIISTGHCINSEQGFHEGIPFRNRAEAATGAKFMCRIF